MAGNACPEWCVWVHVFAAVQLTALEPACLRQGLGLGAVMERRGLGSGEGV